MVFYLKAKRLNNKVKNFLLIGIHYQYTNNSIHCNIKNLRNKYNLFRTYLLISLNLYI